MGFGGSVAAMIQSLKANKRTRVSMFEKDVDKHQKMYGQFTDHKKMSPKAFTLFKKRLELQEQARKRKLYLVFGSVMLIFFVFGIYFLFYY